MKKEEKKTEPVKKETTAVKTGAPEKEDLHKGYNEKNPAQPQGAFTPDSKKRKQSI
jgi:hypothetical protein